jgi:hypothetical protein
MSTEAEYYEIRVRGELDSHWSAWFEGLTLTPLGNGETLVAGPIQDQAALHGILAKIRDLGLPLVSVMSVQHRIGRDDKKGDDYV